MTELKPCPFCGGEAKIECIECTPTINAECLSKTFVIRCTKCRLSAPTPFRIYARIENNGTCEFDDTQKIAAVEFWNRRDDNGL